MSKSHPYLPNSVPDIKERMMEEIGIKTIDDLYVDIPEELRFQGDLDVPGPMTEAEVRQHVGGLLDRNWTFRAPPFLGGGVWPHYVPAVVDEIVHRAEFLTSYTPYQPEISQGILQSIFEYQSLVCELVDMEVTNASMYDWSTALGEAARMVSRLTRRSQIVVPCTISPNRLTVMKSFTDTADIEIIEVDYDETSGQLDLEDLKEKVGDGTAGVYIENPSYLGYVEEGVEAIAEIAHDSRPGVLRKPTPGIAGGPGESVGAGGFEPYGQDVGHALLWRDVLTAGLDVVDGHPVPVDRVVPGQPSLWKVQPHLLP